MALRTRHVRSQFLVLGAFIGVVGWLGCATSNGDPTSEDGIVPAPSSSAKTPAASDDNPDRPAFEAGFPEDAGNTDPTPDGGDTCVDNNDPGASENTAKALPDTNDAQNDPITVNGVLNGPVDVDFYKLAVADTFGHVLQPGTQLKTSGVEMCVFVKCPTGGASVTCNGGGVAKKSDIGTDGCCAAGPSAATPTWNCSGADDGATLFFRIKQTQNKCSPYSFTYAF
ncbi:hypothetical protein BH11MYX4_BH11MYX4_03660 [soil metagenome]